jgi:hypothetical protein
VATSASPRPGQSTTCTTLSIIFGNATSLRGPFRAAAGRALAGGSQHSAMSTRSHRIAHSPSVSAPMGSVTWRIRTAPASSIGAQSGALGFEVGQG